MSCLLSIMKFLIVFTALVLFVCLAICEVATLGKCIIIKSMIRFSSNFKSIAENVQPHTLRVRRTPQSHGRRNQNAMNNAEPTTISNVKPLPSTYDLDDSYYDSDEER